MTEEKRVKEFGKLSVDEQKALVRELFADAGWEAPRVLDGMDQADDFYMQHVAQVKLPSWSRGRMAVLGDAGYCPSPISGMGPVWRSWGRMCLLGRSQGTLRTTRPRWLSMRRC